MVPLSDFPYFHCWLFLFSLDRTNVVQDMLSQSTMEGFIESAAPRRPSFEVFKSSSGGLWSNHRVLWAENGDGESLVCRLRFSFNS